jgi:hypothetical protein
MTGASLNKNAMTFAHEFPHGRGNEADAVLVILDLLWNADQHGAHSLLARRCFRKAGAELGARTVIRKHQFVTSQNRRGSDAGSAGQLTR